MMTKSELLTSAQVLNPTMHVHLQTSIKKYFKNHSNHFNTKKHKKNPPEPRLLPLGVTPTA